MAVARLLITCLLEHMQLAFTNLRNSLAKLKGVNERVWSWDPSKIKWEHAEGFRGEYERSEDFNNREFKKMVRDLARHGGKLTREGYFYWLFENGSTVGRKKRIKNDKSGSDPYEKMENTLNKLKTLNLSYSGVAEGLVSPIDEG